MCRSPADEGITMLEDLDPAETREWLEALDSVLAYEGADRAARVRLGAGTGRDLDMSTPEGAYCGGMETLRGPSGRARIG